MSLTTVAIMYSNTRYISTVNYVHFENNQEQNQIPKHIDQNRLVLNDTFKTGSEVGVENMIVKDSRRLLEVINSSENLSVYIKDLDGVLEDVSNVNDDIFKGNHTETNLETRRGGEFNSPIKYVRDDKIVIALYHIYHTQLKWATKKLDMSKCYHTSNCRVIHQAKCSDTPVEADAVVFQGNNMPRDRPTRLDKNQVFVYLNIESPQYLQQTRIGNPFFNDFFNWTMTYRQDSDIPYLYGTVLPRSYDKSEYLSKAEKVSGALDIKNYHDKYNITDRRTDRDKKNYSAIFRKKKKSSVWFVSHCGTASKRELYISKMKKFTDVDIFGRCSERTNECPKKNPHCGKNVKDNYKFFLAFENSLCEDYITEKVFRWLSEDIIVVVRGARYYKRYLPDGTYIDADGFNSAEDLAKFLTQLGSDEDEYLKYLKRKDEYQVISEEEHVQLAYCNLCYKLNNLERFRKPARLLYEWWNAEKCIRPNDIFR
ncbi:alpha-(1,3)-fucosyltransferase C-like [Mercenaria mercenaria]|uniref:alpha-(1,3)-fucosyltransferase C-like n=1 Tax=Mercenaria mercenaria TaxID=6596 RepID=UPI00234E5C4A|nr:alpha-(1,3)-fucosyltransferase C-like [Mercenaria mercenaria]